MSPLNLPQTAQKGQSLACSFELAFLTLQRDNQPTKTTRRFRLLAELRQAMVNPVITGREGGIDDD